MSEIDKYISKLKESMPFLKANFYVSSIEIFGSYVRGEHKETSDIDILVAFDKTIDLFKFIELENLLSELIGIKVDLVMKDSLKPRIKDRVLKEAIPV